MRSEGPRTEFWGSDPAVRIPAVAETVTIRGTSVYGLNNKASLIVPIAVIQNSEYLLVNALIDSGAQGNFIDKDLARALDTEDLPEPIIMRNVDGTENMAGAIRKQMHIKIMMDDHPFYIKAYVTNLGQTPIILGDTWLQDVNPKIDWARRSLTFYRQSLPKKHASKEALRNFLQRPKGIASLIDTDEETIAKITMATHLAQQ